MVAILRWTKSLIQQLAIGLLGLAVMVGSSWAVDSERKILQQEQAEYPPIAAKMNLHGTVKLKIWIAPNGTVRRLEYVGGHPLLAESALKSAKNWKYATADKETSETIEVKF